MGKSPEKYLLGKKAIRHHRSTKTLIPHFGRLHNLCRSKSKFYHQWHLNPHSGKIHWLALFFYNFLIIGLIISFVVGPPIQTAFAANGSWSQTTFTGSDGTYTNTEPKNSQADAGLVNYSALSNAGGGKWQYKRPITITNGSGSAQTDYQVQVQPFNDATNGNQAGYRYESGLQGSWHLNEGSGATTADLSGNGNNGIMNGSNYWSSSGRYGTAFNSAGNDVFLKSSALIGTLSTATFEGWVKRNIGAGGDIYDEANLPGGSDIVYSIISDSNGYISYRIYVSGTWKIATSSVAIDENWHHVATTLDSSGMKIYIDGVVRGTNSNTSPSTLGIQSVYIAKGGFGGLIDEVKIYNRALSATEITNRYNSNAPKIRHDYQDLRFTKADGTTELPYWQETDGKYWVKYSGSLPTGDTNINMYYGNPSATSSSNYNNTFLALGTGNDGALSVPSGTFNINTNTNGNGGRTAADAVNFSVVDNTSANQNQIIVNSSTTTGLASGDEVLIINLQGTSGDNANVGKYETARISSIANNSPAGKSTITLSSMLRNSYNGTTQKIMVQRVPNWGNVTIDSNATVTANAWDGTKGGVVFFRANGTVTVNGVVDGAKKGYPNGQTYMGNLSGIMYGGGGGGGGGSYAEWYNATPGGAGGPVGGVAGSAGQNVSGGNGGNGGAGGGSGGSGGSGGPTPGAGCGGGGGGGGGGGAYGSHGGMGGGGGDGGQCASGHTGGGNGGTLGTNAGSPSAAGGGNGGGAYGTAGQGGFGGGGEASGSNGNVNSGGNGGNQPGGGLYSGSGGGGGGGGNTYGTSTLAQIYLGSPGGNAVNNSGGIVMIFGNIITVNNTTGSISANGGDYSGKSGGSSGGSILLSGNSLILNTSRVTSNGGAGGSTYGQGGAGGSGRIRLDYYSSLSGTTNPTSYNATGNPTQDRKYASPEPTTFTGSEGNAYVSSGNLISTAISPTGLYGNWGTLTHTRTLNGQTLTIDVLDSANNIITGCGGTCESVASGTNIGASTTTYPSIKLRANFSGDGANTSYLNDWAAAYTYDVTGPTGTTLSWGAVGNTTISITAADATDTESGLRGDGLTYYIERDDNSTSFVTADANSGWITGAWDQTLLSPNTPYAYRVKARDAVGNESGWVTPTPVYKYTLTNAPVLNSFTSPTNDNTPQINSTTVDSSIGNMTVRLYDGITLKATTTAAANGTFTFSNANWGAETLSDGNHTPIYARALNGDGAESGNSNVLTIFVDTQTPTTSISSNPAGPDGNDNWFKTNPAITLTVSDPAPSGGNGTTYYKWDDPTFTNPSTYTAPIDMNATAGQGTHTLYWRTIDSAGNQEDILNQQYKLDSVAPTNLSISIAGGSSYATLNPVNLTLSATDATSGMYQMTFSNDGILYSPWEAYSTSKTWDMTDPLYGGNSNDGLKTVYVKFSDNAGNITNPISDSITLDRVNPTNPTAAGQVSESNPTVITSGNWYNYTTPYFTLSGATDETSGIEGYWVYWGNSSSADPTTGSFQTGNTLSPTILTADSGKTFYLRVRSKDNAGNLYTNADPLVYTLFVYKFDATNPEAVSYITPNPAGWSAVNSFAFSWPAASDPLASGDASGISGYEYKRQPDAGWTFTAGTSISGIQAYQNGVNILQHRTKDNAGNYSSTVTVNYYYSGSIAAPENLQVDLSQSQAQTVNRYKFTWDPPAGPAPQGYYYSINAVPTTQNSTFTANDYTDFDAFATQQGLNTFYVVTKDENGNVGWSNYAQVNFTCNTQAPGIPQGVLITDASNRDTLRWQLTINWDEPSQVTPDFNGYIVERSTNGTDFSQIAITSSQQTGFLDTNLSNTIAYYYRIRAKDNTGNTSAASSTVSKMPTGKYTSPPNLIGTPQVNVQSSKAVVSWTTDRVSDSFVQLGTTTNYGMTQGQLDSTQPHTVNILGLTPGTTYHFRAMWRDIDGNIGYSSDGIFRTQDAPGISEVKVSDVRLNSAIVSWKTTTISTSRVSYGKTNTYGQVAEDSSGSQVTTHTIKLDNLDHSTTYHFKISGTDADGNALSSDDYIFETLTYPKVYNIKFEQQSNAATSTLKVTWESNVPVTSVIEYFEGDLKASREVSKSALETTHSLLVSNLKDNTEYQMIIKGRDAYGNEAVSETQKVKTGFDTRPPEISNIFTESSTSGFGLDAKGQVVVSWETDEPATSQVEYGVGIMGEEYASRTQEDLTLSTTHVVVISDLKPSTAYHFRVVSKDASGNESKSEDNSVLTEQASESIMGLIIKSLEKAIGWLFRI